MSIVNTISFGYQYFRIFVSLREAMFINGILTNADIWYGIMDSELKELEDLDRMLVRKAFQCPVTTPKEACHLELGLLPINSIIKSRRLNYLHYIVGSDKNGMLSKFFKAMSENPSKDDWSEQVKVDLKDLGIREDLGEIEVASKASFKKMVKSKIYEYALDQLNLEKKIAFEDGQHCVPRTENTRLSAKRRHFNCGKNELIPLQNPNGLFL